MASQFETKSSKVGSGWNWIQTRKTGIERVYFEGTVITPHGIVDVYSEQSVTAISFVHDGRLYRRIWRKGFAPQGLSRLAKAFAKEIASKE
jgi:hypothetical protein